MFPFLLILEVFISLCQYDKIGFMAKKRRTKEQKIIAKLRRQLNAQQGTRTGERQDKVKVEPKPTFVYQDNKDKQLGKEEKEKQLKTSQVNKEIEKNKKSSLFSYDEKLLRKDLIKTLVVSLVFIGVIFIIKLVFHL